MAKLRIAQVAYLSQELTQHLKEVNRATVKACLELEKVRLILNELLLTYDQWYGEDVTRILR